MSPLAVAFLSILAVHLTLTIWKEIIVAGFSLVLFFTVVGLLSVCNYLNS